MQRTMLLIAAAFLLPSAASAQSNPDARYCDKLIGLYRTYVNNPQDPRPGKQTPQADHENAILSCQTGNTSAGIPVLEKVLGDNKLNLPARGEG